MTYGELKQTDMYLNANDIDLCVNGEDPIDEMYYPEELDQLPVVGTGNMANSSLLIDLVCSNWDKRFEVGWVPKI
jgi:hypothetical protein